MDTRVMNVFCLEMEKAATAQYLELEVEMEKTAGGVGRARDFLSGRAGSLKNLWKGHGGKVDDVIEHMRGQGRATYGAADEKLKTLGRSKAGAGNTITSQHQMDDLTDTYRAAGKHKEEAYKMKEELKKYRGTLTNDKQLQENLNNQGLLGKAKQDALNMTKLRDAAVKDTSKANARTLGAAGLGVGAVGVTLATGGRRERRPAPNFMFGG